MLTEAYVAGLTKDNARMLLDRAKDLGLPASVVKTVDGGFIVPAVLVEDDPKAKAEPETEPDTEADTEAKPEPESEPEDDDSEAEPEEQPAPKRRAPARRTKTKAADDDETAEPVESEE